MEHAGLAANPGQKMPSLLIDAITLASDGQKRNTEQIQELINSFEKFLGLAQTKYSKESRYPGEGPNNICLGCGGYIDEATHFCPEGTDHKYKIPGRCGIRPEKGQLSILTRLVKAVSQRIACGHAQTRELTQALQEFKDLPSPSAAGAAAKTAQETTFDQFEGRCPKCGHSIDEGGHCGCPASLH